jgi:hypothetical protein
VTFPDVVGSTGVSLLLLAFFLNLFGFLESQARGYQLLNLAGAGLACWASWMIGFIPFVVLEVIWGTVAAVALVRGAPARH